MVAQLQIRINKIDILRTAFLISYKMVSVNQARILRMFDIAG